MARQPLMLVVAAAALLGGCATAGPGTVAIRGPNEHALVRVPAGSYSVGATGQARNPRRTVSLEAFEIATRETTNAQFARFVERTGYVTDAERDGFGMVFEEGMLDWQWRRTPGACWRKPFGDDRYAAATHPDYPVTQISGADAAAYCAWAGGRLPTVTEWEAAARAGADTRWPWGDEFLPDGKPMANVWSGADHTRDRNLDGFLYLAPVGSFPPNHWGLCDVIGNVFEYCSGGVVGVRPGVAEEMTAARGGSWWCSAGTCDSFNLVDIGQMVRHGSFANQGFRFARSAPPRRTR